MFTKPYEMTKYQTLCEKSEDLRAHSNGLLWEARSLCDDSRKLRARNALLALTNSSPNAARKRYSIWTLASRFSSRPKINYTIGVRLHGVEQDISDPKKLP